MLPTARSAETGVEQSEALHHSCIVGLVLSEMMRHEQQLGVVALEVRDRFPSERVRTDRINPLDNISARVFRNARQQTQLLAAAWRLKRNPGGLRLCMQEPIEHTKARHEANEIANIARAACRYVEQLRIVCLEVGYDLCTADIRTAIIELARDPLARHIADSWQGLHPSTPENLAACGGAYCWARDSGDSRPFPAGKRTTNSLPPPSPSLKALTVPPCNLIK
jgi:hypothetical protein